MQTFIRKSKLHQRILESLVKFKSLYILLSSLFSIWSRLLPFISSRIKKNSANFITKIQHFSNQVESALPGIFFFLSFSEKFIWNFGKKKFPGTWAVHYIRKSLRKSFFSWHRLVNTSGAGKAIILILSWVI